METMTLQLTKTTTDVELVTTLTAVLLEKGIVE